MSVSHRAIALLVSISSLAGFGNAEAGLTIPNEMGLPGVFETHSSQGIKAGGMSIGTSTRLTNGLGSVEGGRLESDGEDAVLDDAAAAAFRSYLSVGLGLGLDLSLFLPYYYEYLPGARNSPEAWEAGDFSGILKAKLPFGIPFHQPFPFRYRFNADLFEGQGVPAQATRLPSVFGQACPIRSPKPTARRCIAPGWARESPSISRIRCAVPASPCT